MGPEPVVALDHVGDEQRAAVERYLATGDYDPRHAAWPGSISESGRAARDAYTEALIREVERRSREGRPAEQAPHSLPDDLVLFSRTKLEPMVAGLFPAAEREMVLRVLERSVVVLSSENIESVLRQSRWLHTAWALANLYLGSVGAQLLADDAPRIVGLSEETTCYVSTAYFREQDPFADFIVHEAAHVFHNCKRETLGLPETRTREWLLEIAYRKRETFAYACEAWSRILEQAKTKHQRLQLVDELAARGVAADEERLDHDEFVDILREAARARNGWKHILSRCASERVPTRTCRRQRQS